MAGVGASARRRPQEDIALLKGSTALRTSISVFVLISLTSVIWAEPATRLTGAELTEFTQQRLNISIQDRFIGSVSEFGLITGRTMTDWVPYQGFRAIAEPDFFFIAGFQLEAEESRQHHQTTRNLTIWGTVFTLIGVGIALGALLVSEPSEPDDWLDSADWEAYEREEDAYYRRTFGLLIAGTVVMTGGLTALVAGSMRGNWATADQAVFVMDQYNQQLLDEIRER